MLVASGWVVQSKKQIDFNAGLGVAVREYQTDIGPADYVLFVDRQPVGIVEAKKEEEGYHLTVVEEQSGDYAKATGNKGIANHSKREPEPPLYLLRGLTILAKGVGLPQIQ